MLRARSARRRETDALLFEAGALALQEDGDRITTHFPTENSARSAADAVLRADPAAEVEIRATSEVDYSKWRAAVRAWRVGELTIAPPWLAEDYDSRRTVVIDPAMAFGTGEHATTRGVLNLMQRVVRAGDVVADLGTGSAVLAIAAAKLGASAVIGLEHDLDAVANAETNVQANGVGDRVTIIAGDAGTLLPLIAPVRVALANIASLALVQLLPTIGAALTQDGVAVLSGVLTAEERGFRARLGGWRITHELVEEDWWTAAIARR